MLENLASLLGGSELFRWKGRQPTILKENEWSEYSEYIMEVGYLKKMTNNKMKCEKWGQTFAFIESNSWGNFAGKKGKKKRNLPYMGKKPNPESGNQGRHGEPFLENFVH